jgi:hypothetical protein
MTTARVIASIAAGLCIALALWTGMVAIANGDVAFALLTLVAFGLAISLAKTASGGNVSQPLGAIVVIALSVLIAALIEFGALRDGPFALKIARFVGIAIFVALILMRGIYSNERD